MEIQAPGSWIKKKSPSTFCRNAKWREEYLKKRVSTSQPTQPTPKGPEKEKSFFCDVCDYTGESQIGLNVHMNRKHKNIPQLDGA